MKKEPEYETRGLMDMTHDALCAERRRLREGIDASEVVQGTIADSYYFKCDGNAAEVLERAREAIAIVSDATLDGPWPSVEEWMQLLPKWFIDACKPEDEPDVKITYPEDLEQRRAIYFSQKWKVSDWLSWLEPEDRRWLWLDAEVLDPDTVLAHVDVVTDPFDLGAPPGFWWLFAAAGAKEFDNVKDVADFYSVRGR